MQILFKLIDVHETSFITYTISLLDDRGLWLPNFKIFHHQFGFTMPFLMNNRNRFSKKGQEEAMFRGILCESQTKQFYNSENCRKN